MGGTVEMHRMMYEDLRSLADTSYQRILRLEETEANLRSALTLEIEHKNRLKDQLADKTAECKDFMARLEVKIDELEKEETAHKAQIVANKGLQAEIENLRRQIEELQ